MCDTTLYLLVWQQEKYSIINYNGLYCTSRVLTSAILSVLFQLAPPTVKSHWSKSIKCVLIGCDCVTGYFHLQCGQTNYLTLKTRCLVKARC